MNFEELKNKKIISDIVKALLDNDKFYNDCKKNIISIFNDKIIDSNDIPAILNLIILCFNNYNKISIDKKDIKEVLILLFIELINKININISISNEEIIRLLEPNIDLLLISINFNKNCFRNFIENCCGCCYKENNKINNP